MICPKCNAEIKDGSNFCSKCGAEYEDIKINDSQIKEENFAQNRQKNGISGWRMLFFILLVADVISWTVFTIADSGLFGTLGMLFLVLLLAVIAGSLGVIRQRLMIKMKQNE